MSATPSSLDAGWASVIAAGERLATARSMTAVVAVLRETARAIAGAEGIAVVLRDGDLCHYAAEDAAAPLWQGQRFPMAACVSGWAMTHRETVRIADVFADPRVPADAYRPTFVRSMLMVPVGQPQAVAAIGAYWSAVRPADPETVAKLEALARSATIALENARMEAELRTLAASLEERVGDRTAELMRTQEALRQSQKLEAMGQLTGGVAHDFNNLLTPIMGSLDLLHRRRLGGERERALIKGALDSAERARTLVQRLLAFARRQPLVPSPVDLAETLAQLATLLETTLGREIELTLAIEEALPLALADRTQIEMAVLNLAINARDAMPGGGRLAISARRDWAGDAHPAGLAAGDYVVLAVCDEGAGMAPEVLERAVEPFFSTKGVGKGTGLGLSMAHGLAQQLGGALGLESVAGEGTTARLWLPLAAEPMTVEPIALPAATTPRPPMTALLVDDEPLARASTADMLAELGFRVIEARDTREALAQLDAQPVDLLVTDHIMPGMTGAELATQVRAARPETKVLLISGYAEPGGLAPDLMRLAKPFRQADLIARLDALLAPPN